MKVMATGLPGGTSFMEDYTYHLAPGAGSPRRPHARSLPLDRGGQAELRDPPARDRRKPDPVRLVFTAPRAGARGKPRRPGRPVPPGRQRDRRRGARADLPRLPVARALWQPRPDLRTAAEAWLLAGGRSPHGVQHALGIEHLADFAEMARSNCSSSTTPPGSSTSRTSFAGTRPITSSAEGC